eukprot:2006367-Karenia_brevis.AAC.1
MSGLKAETAYQDIDKEGIDIYAKYVYPYPRPQQNNVCAPKEGQLGRREIAHACTALCWSHLALELARQCLGGPETN